MQPITAEQLRAYAPRAQRHYVDALVGGWSEIQAAGIDTQLRWCHFLAQAAHETGYFTIVRENCTWSAKRMAAIWPNRFKLADPVFQARYRMCGGEENRLAELAYGGRKDLGNIEDGDGYAYRGGGFCQGTGRAWYRETGQQIGVDLEHNPDLIEDPRVSLRAYLAYWQRYKINRWADQNNIRAVSCQINCGNPHSSYDPVGFDERKKAFDRAWAIFGAAGEAPTLTALTIGSHGPAVVGIQAQLKELRYSVGATDGIYGPETGRALAAFKADYQREHNVQLEPGDHVGPLTRAALAQATPIERPERAATKAKDLLEAGSSEMKAGQDMKKIGAATAAIGATGTASKSGLLDWAQGWADMAPSLQSIVAPINSAIKFGAEHLPFVALLILGALWWYRGDVVQRARLLAHRLGFNLSR